MHQRLGIGSSSAVGATGKDLFTKAGFSIPMNPFSQVQKFSAYIDSHRKLTPQQIRNGEKESFFDKVVSNMKQTDEL
jgi:hypothetical protein